jgi:hypothetical protein
VSNPAASASSLDSPARGLEPEELEHRRAEDRRRRTSMTEDVVAGELTRPIGTQRERKPDRLAGDGMARVDAVAGRVDVLVGGSQVVVHRDRPGGAERKPRSRCQLGLGSNAGRDQHQIGLERRVGGLHGGARAPVRSIASTRVPTSISTPCALASSTTRARSVSGNQGRISGRASTTVTAVPISRKFSVASSPM